MKKILRLGTRGSPLALVQAQTVRSAILRTHPGLEENFDIEIVPINTTGDWRPEQQERTFLEMGGNKGLFTKEIEEALLSDHVDFAVHSMKDVATLPPEALEFAAILEREDPRDAFISHKAQNLDDLPEGAVVGTSSLRRQAQILARRPDLRVTALRGNVDTRLQKLSNGDADATILAVAGLKRLGMEQRISSTISTQVMLPSAAQGAIGIQIRANDENARQIITPLNHQATMTCITAERALLRVLDGSCRSPIAALATVDAKGKLTLDALVAKPDGSTVVRQQKSGDATKAAQIGQDLGAEMKHHMSPDFFVA